MRRLIALIPLAAFSPIGVSALAGEACPFDPSSLQGGQVYYVNGRPAKAVQLSDAALLEGSERGKPIELYYIVKSGARDRSGVIVIKSARFGTSLKGNDPKADQVGLSRLAASTRCDTRKDRSFSGSVSTRAYSEYHDYGQDNGTYLKVIEGGRSGRDTLKRFHTSYVGSDGSCRATDAKTLNDGTYVARSNRSQFSFDTDIVDFGFNTAVYNIATQTYKAGWSYLVPTAVADSPTKLRKRRVEIKRYRTQNGYACIPFSVEMRGPLQALRVNDLESRSADYYARTEFRLGPTTGSAP